MKQIISILFFIPFIVEAQDYGKDLERIFKEFADLKSYEIVATVILDGDDSQTFSSSIRSSIHGSQVRANQTETLVNRRYAVAINHEEKTIRVDRGDYVSKGNRNADLGIDMIAESINDQVKIEYLGKTGVYRTYRILNEDEMTKVVVKINNRTNFFHEIEVFYESDDISISSYRVRYDKLRKNPEYRRKDFSETQFFTQTSKGDIKPTAAYSDYRIIKQF